MGEDVNTAHCESPAFAKRWAETPALACLRYLFNLKNDQASQRQVDESVAVLKEKMTKFGAVSRSFFTLGTLLGQNKDTLAIFEQLVDQYSVSPAFLHELSGLDKKLMCKNIKFSAAIFSKDLGL